MPSYNTVRPLQRPYTKYRVHYQGKIWAGWRADGKHQEALEEDTIFKLQRRCFGEEAEALAGELDLTNPRHPYQN